MTTTDDRPTREVDRPELAVGDRIRIHPENGGNRWWTVRAADDRYTVATRRAAFATDDSGAPGVVYTVIDWTGWERQRRNGAGFGPVRSSLNTLGGGWDIGVDGEGAEEILAVLQSEEWELSRRRLLNVDRLELEGAPR